VGGGGVGSCWLGGRSRSDKRGATEDPWGGGLPRLCSWWGTGLGALLWERWCRCVGTLYFKGQEEVLDVVGYLTKGTRFSQELKGTCHQDEEAV